MTFFPFFLTLCVIYVNGFTDAPNAVATCIATRSLGVQPAIFLSALCNFAGALFMTGLNNSVSLTISNMVSLDGLGSRGLLALCAALLAIVIWAVSAWYFGIPTSESHALVAGLLGAAIALHGGTGGIGNEWKKILYGLFISTVPGFFAGFLCCKLLRCLFARSLRSRTNSIFGFGQILASAAMSFLHGAQDGQKFMGIFVLLYSLNFPNLHAGAFSLPLPIVLVCSAMMGLGTLTGGKRIIKTVGMDMVHLEKYQGFAADLACSGCLLFCSLFGIPTSTTHTKTTAIMGSGAAVRLSSVRLSFVREMALVWLFTFPGCGLLGYLATKGFLLVFP